MKLGIASDHAAFSLKEALKSRLKKIEWVDFGCDSEDSIDYPDVVPELCQNLLDDRIGFGVLLCGTGIGVSITANRFRGVRAALCHNEFTVEMARKHNNANILAMGARTLSQEQAVLLLEKFVSTPYENGRHQRRIEKIDRLTTFN